MQRWIWLALTGVVLSLGWGLRGYIGGGPLGAMIPGATAALALATLAGRNDREAGVIAALGAVGIGFGGQMTYGQTIGLALDPATRTWGLTGLGLKGAIWGLLGGAVLGWSFVLRRLPPARTMPALALMVAFTWIGWKTLNEPKLIYFSNRLDRPRPEIWFGLLLGAAALLAWIWLRAEVRVPLRFALWGALGGGFGFAVGGYIQVLGRAGGGDIAIGYWKVMEFTLGLCLGLAYAQSASAMCDAFDDPLDAPPPASNLLMAVRGAAMAGVTLWVLSLPLGRFEYTIVGAVLIALAMVSARDAWQIAVTLTYCAFSIDFLRSRAWSDATAWAAVALSTLAVAWLTARTERARPLLLWLMWLAVANSFLKSFGPPSGSTRLIPLEATFTGMAIIATWLVLRLPAPREPFAPR
ncbi:MAG: hypothetical protein U0Q16_16770 [Bryobacteraceae bacterium]